MEMNNKRKSYFDGRRPCSHSHQTKLNNFTDSLLTKENGTFFLTNLNCHCCYKLFYIAYQFDLVSMQ